jgi:hypothetical protein
MGYSPTGDPCLTRELTSLKVFSLAADKKIKHVMHGKIGGVDVIVFQLHQSTEDGTTYASTVARFASPQLDLPDFRLEPKGALQRKCRIFPSFPEFCKAYSLRTKDEAAIRDLFREEVLAYLECREGIHLRGQSSTLFFCLGPMDAQVPAEHIPLFLEEGLRMLSMLSRTPMPQVPSVTPEMVPGSITP